MARTKFFRVAVAGPTVDGREITPEQIQQMADTYNLETYTARMNCEHLRGYSPDGPFNAWGTVVAVKAEKVDLAIGGKTEKRLALFAQFDVTDQAKDYNKAGQKLFSSVEIQPNFAGSNKAYLVGSAVTDSPASLGTEMLTFSRDDKRKDNLRQVEEFTLEYEEAAPPAADAATGAFAAMTAFFKNFTPKAAEQPATPAAPNPNEAFAQFATGMAAQMDVLSNGIATSISALEARIAAQSEEVTTLKHSIENTTSTKHNVRPLTSGGNGRAKAEC